jgi:hypothetical protein
MKKILLTACAFPEKHPFLVIFEEKIKPRLVKYCEKHDFELIVIDKIKSSYRDWSWMKMFWVKENIDEFQDGDVITYIDADCCIMDGREPFIFDVDFSVVQESTGCLCAGFWSIIISDWSRKFIEEICSEERHEKNKGLGSWQTWHENDAIYHLLGLNWGQNISEIGTRETTPFTIEELKEHVKILPAKWNVTYNPNDVDWSKNNYKVGDKSDPDWIYKIISNYYNPDRYCSFDDTIIRHLSGGTLYRDWANKYFNKEIKL